MGGVEGLKLANPGDGGKTERDSALNNHVPTGKRKGVKGRHIGQGEGATIKLSVAGVCSSSTKEG